MKIISKYFVIAVIAFVSLTAPYSAAAQQPPESTTTPTDIFSIIPQPFIELFETVNRIQIDFSRYEIVRRAADYLPRTGKDASGILNRITNGFNRIDDFISQYIGVGLRNILVAAGNAFIWILEFIIRLIRLGMSYL